GGLALEAVADAQKAAWRGRAGSAGRWIDEGLWSLSRHPNYCGEMMLWCGIYLLCAPGLPSTSLRLAAAASPLTVFLLLRFLSGVPPLEAAAEARWGGLQEYREYKERTRLLLPLPGWGGGQQAHRS
ncbi:hypothetical protein Agub_g930, partial [Astrephomene gubernaculifera]